MHSRGFAVASCTWLRRALIVAIGRARDRRRRPDDVGRQRVDAYFTEAHGQPREVDADRDVDRLQSWLNTHHLSSVKVQERGHKAVERIRERDVGRYTSRAIDFVEGAAVSIGKTLFALVLLS